MLRRLVRFAIRHIARAVLGPAASAGRQVADREQRIAMPARLLEVEEARSVAAAAPEPGAPRRVGHLTVYEGGRSGRPVGDGPLGRPSLVSRGGCRMARG